MVFSGVVLLSHKIGSTVVLDSHQSQQLAMFYTLFPMPKSATLCCAGVLNISVNTLLRLVWATGTATAFYLFFKSCCSRPSCSNRRMIASGSCWTATTTPRSWPVCISSRHTTGWTDNLWRMFAVITGHGPIFPGLGSSIQRPAPQRPPRSGTARQASWAAKITAGCVFCQFFTINLRMPTSPTFGSIDLSLFAL